MCAGVLRAPLRLRLVGRPHRTAPGVRGGARPRLGPGPADVQTAGRGRRDGADRGHHRSAGRAARGRTVARRTPGAGGRPGPARREPVRTAGRRAEPRGVLAAARRCGHRLRPADHLDRHRPRGGRPVGPDAAHPARPATAGSGRQPGAHRTAGHQRGPAVLDGVDAVVRSRGPRRCPRDPAPRALRARLHAVPVRLGHRGGPRALRVGAARLRGRARPRGAAEPGGGVRVVRRGHHRLPYGRTVPHPLRRSRRPGAAKAPRGGHGGRGPTPGGVSRREGVGPPLGSVGGGRMGSSARRSTPSRPRSGAGPSPKGSRSGSCSCRSPWSPASARWCRWPRRRS